MLTATGFFIYIYIYSCINLYLSGCFFVCLFLCLIIQSKLMNVLADKVKFGFRYFFKGIFPIATSQVANFPSGKLPKWQTSQVANFPSDNIPSGKLPKCAISQTASSQRLG